MSRPHTYKVLLDDQQLDLVIEGENLIIAGESQDFVVDQIKENTYNIILNNRSYRLFIESIEDNKYTLQVNGSSHEITVKDERDLLLDSYGIADHKQSIEKEVRAPMPGLVLDVLVKQGDVVPAGKGLLVLEAMKMENELKASTAGKVARIHVNPGDPVAKGDLLLELDNDASLLEE